MTIGFSATAMLELIEGVFEGRETVNKYDVVQAAQFYPLGPDGETAISHLEARRYTRDQLTEALTAAIIDAAGSGDTKR